MQLRYDGLYHEIVHSQANLPWRHFHRLPSESDDGIKADGAISHFSLFATGLTDPLALRAQFRCGRLYI